MCINERVTKHSNNEHSKLFIVFIVFIQLTMKFEIQSIYKFKFKIFIHNLYNYVHYSLH